MSTAPEDNTRPENTNRPAEGAPQPKFEPGFEPGYATDPAVAGQGAQTPEDGVEGAEHGQEYDHEHEFEVPPAEPRTGGAFSSETLSIVGVILLAVTVLTGQLLEILTSMILVGGQPIDPNQIRQIEMQIWLGGAVALLTVLSSTLALALLNSGTRHWAKWTATATTIVGFLFVLVAAAAFLLIPEAAPQQMLPPIMD
ncbi:hypothetical protein [Nocardiopsis metallicus]|uniref:Uncharacterized protein n=1 Tax=Nocardiopsis metallicus TaxID=179819 RepID=A0A840W4F2_9ACTN|nr:hypothetical protein [Nocardiopsis metallicus]MBB5491840.1 hypothetical protein [Nocardiopsis metallicus]